MRRAGRYFNVRTPAEEFSCPRCGQPVQADRPEPGEPDFSRAWSDNELRDAFCSVTCAEREAEDRATEEEHERRAANAVHP